ncbi:hypothetical protein E4U21_004435 [Claviceps maximensis]|nr:hypothetical protein E4U21_004435 [Claviceps maximensis]
MNCNELQEGNKPSRYVTKRPKALQWFYNGCLYKESDEERQASRDDLAEHPDGAHMAKYIHIFAPAWHINAVEISHEIDCMAAFFTIILGEFVYSFIVGDPAGNGLTSGNG